MPNWLGDRSIDGQTRDQRHRSWRVLRRGHRARPHLPGQSLSRARTRSNAPRVAMRALFSARRSVAGDSVLIREFACGKNRTAPRAGQAGGSIRGPWWGGSRPSTGAVGRSQSCAKVPRSRSRHGAGAARKLLAQRGGTYVRGVRRNSHCRGRVPSQGPPSQTAWSTSPCRWGRARRPSPHTCGEPRPVALGVRLKDPPHNFKGTTFHQAELGYCQSFRPR
jgi:hypothetical protein